MGAHHYLTKEEEDFLREHAPKMSRLELTNLFNQTFGTSWHRTTVTNWCVKRGLSNGNDGRFKDGHHSWQTGLSGEEYRKHYSEESWKKSRSGLVMYEQKYQEGELFERHGLPVYYLGGESGTKLDDRLVYASTKIWEDANGPISPNQLLIHIDGNIQNFNLENLKAIPRNWLPVLRWLGGLTDNLELNKAKLAYCEVWCALKEG